jgi:SAM-dependent methyltransferase
MPDFAVRSDRSELMDGETVSTAEFAACLTDLAKANTATLARPATLAWLGRAIRSLPPGSGFSLVDVGYGHGDMLRAIRAWAARRGLAARLTGIDLNPRSAPAARAATDAALDIEYLTGDVLDYRPPAAPDFVISSLVAHHMTNAELLRFLAWMEAVSRRGWFVNDLHRHPLAYYGFQALSKLAGWHHFVRHDGPISVARSFRRGDWEALLAAADIPAAGTSIEWRFPFRLCVGRIK